MANKVDTDDIIMEDHIGYRFNEILPSFNFRKCPSKRTYLEMLNDTHDKEMNSRIDNYKIITKNKISFENKFLGNNNNSYETKKIESLIKITNDNDMNKIKKNLVIRKKMEYDEEKEKRFVENYYRIKNAELIRLRFGTE